MTSGLYRNAHRTCPMQRDDARRIIPHDAVLVERRLASRVATASGGLAPAWPQPQSSPASRRRPPGGHAVVALVDRPPASSRLATWPSSGSASGWTPTGTRRTRPRSPTSGWRRPARVRRRRLGEGPHRLRPRHPHQAQRRALRRRSSTPSSACASTASGCPSASPGGARPDRGDGVRGGAHHEAEVRHERAGAPGRNPVVLAKELATLDRLSGGRLLPAFGLGVADPPSSRPSASTARSGPLVRRGLAADAAPVAEDASTTTAPASTTRACACCPKPRNSRPTSGSAASHRPSCAASAAWATGGCRRSSSPRTVAAGRADHGQAAEQHGRSIDRTTTGSLIPYAERAPPVPHVAGRAAPTRPHRAIPVGVAALARRLEQFIEVGASKFVVVPFDEPPGDQMADHLAEVAAALLPLQT